MKTHLIDMDEGVWDDDYERFHKARCEAISKKLKAKIKYRPIDDTNSGVMENDIDPDDEQDVPEEHQIDAT